MRRSVLHVNDSHHAVARDDGSRKESFERIFRQLTEVFESRVFIGFPRYREQTPLPRYPPREAFVQFQANLPDFGLVMRVGRAQYKLIAIAKIDKAGIALRELDNQ